MGPTVRRYLDQPHPFEPEYSWTVKILISKSLTRHCFVGELIANPCTEEERRGDGGGDVGDLKRRVDTWSYEATHVGRRWYFFSLTSVVWITIYSLYKSTLSVDFPGILWSVWASNPLSILTTNRFEFFSNGLPSFI